MKHGFLVAEESSIPLCLKTMFTGPIESSGKPRDRLGVVRQSREKQELVQPYIQFYVYHRTQFHSSILVRKLCVCQAILSTANNERDLGQIQTESCHSADCTQALWPNVHRPPKQRTGYRALLQLIICSTFPLPCGDSHHVA